MVAVEESVDGEGAVEESEDLEAAGWIGGLCQRWLCELEDWGDLVAPLPARRQSQRIYMALQYYQNILIISFAGCMSGGV